MTVTLDQVKAALQKPLPGLPAQMGMAPIPRPGSDRILDPELDCKHAATLLLLYPEHGRLHLVLTRRTDLVASHQGQISLPGGAMEPGETTEQAALREAWEELGIEPDQVEIIGALSRLFVPPSGFCIRPVVGYSPARPQFHPAPLEVAEVIETPLDLLLDDGICRTETWFMRGENVQVPYYAIGPHKVWGATAMTLCEFLALVKPAVE